MKTGFTLALAAYASASRLRAMHNTPEQDACECVSSSGATVYFETLDPESGYTLYTDEDGNEIQYPWDYGVGQCAAWDEGLEGFGCDGDDAPGYCGEPWCYVSEDCALFDDVTASAVVDGQFYSYQTCGGDGDAEAENAGDEDGEGEGDDDAEGDAEGEGDEGDDEAADEEGEDDGCGADAGCGSNNVSIKIDFGVDA